MTDELIGDLAKIKDILVISRNSAFTYKGKSTKIQQIAKELNVQYILEGSVQKSGNKVRIRAQLIDGKTDHHLWSESYDGEWMTYLNCRIKLQERSYRPCYKTDTDEQNRISEKDRQHSGLRRILKGHEHYARMTGKNILQAIEYYQQGYRDRSKFQRVYSGLAVTYFMLNH